MAIRTLQSVIEQHIPGLPGLIAVLVGRVTDGKTVAKVQPVKGSRGTIAALSKPTSEGGWIDQ